MCEKGKKIVNMCPQNAKKASPKKSANATYELLTVVDVWQTCKKIPLVSNVKASPSETLTSSTVDPPVGPHAIAAPAPVTLHQPIRRPTAPPLLPPSSPHPPPSPQPLPSTATTPPPSPVTLIPPQSSPLVTLTAAHHTQYKPPAARPPNSPNSPTPPTSRSSLAITRQHRSLRPSIHPFTCPTSSPSMRQPSHVESDIRLLWQRHGMLCCATCPRQEQDSLFVRHTYRKLQEGGDKTSAEGRQEKPSGLVRM